MSEGRKREHKDDDLLTAKEAMEYLQVKKTKFHEDIKPNLTPSVMGGRGKKYEFAELKEYKKQCKKIKNPAPEASQSSSSPRKARRSESSRIGRNMHIISSSTVTALEDLVIRRT